MRRRMCRGFARVRRWRRSGLYGYVFTPEPYVGAEETEDDDEPFEEKLQRLTAKLAEPFAESAKLEGAIQENLRKLGL